MIGVDVLAVMDREFAIMLAAGAAETTRAFELGEARAAVAELITAAKDADEALGCMYLGESESSAAHYRLRAALTAALVGEKAGTI